jgi:hypothetical protein
MKINAAQTDCYVVLTTKQWIDYGLSRSRPLSVSAAYVPCFDETYARHIIIQDTIGM